MVIVMVVVETVTRAMERITALIMEKEIKLNVEPDMTMAAI